MDFQKGIRLEAINSSKFDIISNQRKNMECDLANKREYLFVIIVWEENKIGDSIQRKIMVME